MLIEPYKRRPEPPTVALLDPEGVAWDEHGTRLDLDADDFPKTTRVWASFDTTHRLLADGVGEALCWNGEEIHWRREPRPEEPGWRARASDVHVLRIPENENDTLTMRALVEWRDWLASYGASPTGTTGSSAQSLLRATLRGPLRTSSPASSCPPLASTVGGRQELGPAGRGRYEGRLELWDIPSAYATELGNLRYGGRWFQATEDFGEVDREQLERMAADGLPCFASAVVDVASDLGYGPLPRRPRTSRSRAAVGLLGCEYPVGRRLQGVWAWQELRAAESVGCRIIRLRDYWAHWSSVRPFAGWLAAVEEGRKIRGLGGTLAKMTGNALWGRFCMDSRSGVRTVRSSAGVRRVVRKGWIPAAHDLAETVSGRTRARLYGQLVGQGDMLVSAHTDGFWARAGELEPEGWRRKTEANKLDLLSPQTLRYWPVPRHPEAPFVVAAGVTAGEAAGWFEQEWERFCRT